MKHIQLHHFIWKKNLSPNALKTYCALLSFENRATGRTIVGMKKIATAVDLSISSIARGLAELEQKELITKYNRFLGGQYIASSYRISKRFGGFTRIPVEALKCPINAYGFMVYCFILKCSNAEGKAFPSLRGIAKEITLAVTTIIKHIKVFVLAGIVTKTNYIKKNNAFGHNQYQLITLFLPLDREREQVLSATHSLITNAHKYFNTSIILQ